MESFGKEKIKYAFISYGSGYGISNAERLLNESKVRCLSLSHGIKHDTISIVYSGKMPDIGNAESVIKGRAMLYSVQGLDIKPDEILKRLISVEGVSLISCYQSPTSFSAVISGKIEEENG